MAKKIIFLLMISLFFLLPGSNAEKNNTGFTIGRLKYGGGGDWYNDRSIIPNLLKEVGKRLDIPVADNQVIIDPGDDLMFTCPLLFMTGHGNVKFTAEERERLRLYLENGGFLYVDDDYGLDKPFRRELKKIFPDHQLVELPFSHPIYRSHYRFDNGLPKIHEHDNKPPRGFGLFLDGRLVLFYTYETNISDGWADPDVYQDPPEKREAAFKMGVNIVAYTMLY